MGKGELFLSGGLYLLSLSHLYPQGNGIRFPYLNYIPILVYITVPFPPHISRDPNEHKEEKFFYTNTTVLQPEQLVIVYPPLLPFNPQTRSSPSPVGHHANGHRHRGRPRHGAAAGRRRAGVDGGAAPQAVRAGCAVGRDPAHPARAPLRRQRRPAPALRVHRRVPPRVAGGHARAVPAARREDRLPAVHGRRSHRLLRGRRRGPVRRGGERRQRGRGEAGRGRGPRRGHVQAARPGARGRRAPRGGAGRAGHAAAGRGGARRGDAPRRGRRPVGVDVPRGVGGGEPRGRRRGHRHGADVRPRGGRAPRRRGAREEHAAQVRARSATGHHGVPRRPEPPAPDVHRLRAAHPPPEAAHRRPHEPAFAGAGRRAVAVQLRGRRGARLGLLRPVQAPGRRHLRRRRRVPLLLHRLPRAARHAPAGERELLRGVHLRVPREGDGAGPARRGRGRGRRGGGAGGGPARCRGPARAVGLVGHTVVDPAGPDGGRVRVDAVPGVRGGRLRVGRAEQDGAGHHEPRRAGGARRRQGRRRRRAGVRVYARRSHGRVRLALPERLRLIGEKPAQFHSAHAFRVDETSIRWFKSFST